MSREAVFGVVLASALGGAHEHELAVGARQRERVAADRVDERIGSRGDHGRVGRGVDRHDELQLGDAGDAQRRAPNVNCLSADNADNGQIEASDSIWLLSASSADRSLMCIACTAATVRFDG